MRVYRALIGGEPNTLSIGVELPDMAAFGSYVEKLTADPEWQSFYQRVAATGRETAELVSTALYQEVEA